MGRSEFILKKENCQKVCEIMIKDSPIEATENSTSLKVIFRSLQHRNYRLFFCGQSISLVGTWMQHVALAWLVYRITGSVVMLGLVGFASQIPIFLLTPFTGVLTDRWNRHIVLIVTQSAAMVLTFILTGIFFIGTIEIWQIFLLSISLGCINAFDIPARQSFAIDLVEKKEDLGNAIALNSLMFNGAILIGPSLAGLLLAVEGEGICFLINGISYLFVIVSLLMMKVAPGDLKKKNVRFFKEMKDGLKYTFGFAPIKYLILFLALVNLLAVPYTVLMPVFAKEILHGGSNIYGFLIGASGFGALLGAIYLASGKTILRIGKIISWSAAIFGLGLILFSFSRFYLFSFILMIVIGFGDMLHTAASNTILQTITDDDKRGRVMSFYTMAIVGIAPFGSLLVGELAKVIGTPNTILIGGITCIIGALIFLKKLPDLKKLVRHVYVNLGVFPKQTSDIQTVPEHSLKATYKLNSD